MSESHANDPLPPGWSRGFSNSQKKHFYFHKETDTTQWHFPTASEARDPTVAKRRAAEAKKREALKAPPSAGNGNSNNHDSTSSSKRPRVEKVGAAASVPTDDTDDFLEQALRTSVAIIVPFRDIHAEQKRAAHLQAFVPHMIQFLTKCQKRGLISNFHIYIVEQSNDGLKFNRGKLLNIGFDVARKSKKRHDVFIFHDVDLLPADDLMTWYSKFPQRPIHIARVWNRYSGNPKYIGGVVSFSSSDYNRINGYPNNFFGWGGEDDEMQRRLERLGIRFESPDKGTLRDLEEMDITEKMDFLRHHKEWKCQVKWELKDEHESTWKTNGLADLKYSMLKETPLDKDGKATKLTADVKLNGSHWTNEKAAMDYMETSWKK